MKPLRIYLYMFLVVLALSLSLAYWQLGYFSLVLTTLILSGFWGLAQWRDWEWANALVFALSIALVGLGAWSGGPPTWLLLGLVSSLAFWDLGRFTRLTEMAGFIRDESRMIRAHLIRLGGVLVIGVGLSLLALNISLGVNFDMALILAFVLIFSLSRVVGYLRE